MRFFSIFSFVKINNKVKHLEQNEKISLKQEFEDTIANCQEKIFLRTYFVSGLKEDCDILFWRMHNSLQWLQSICSKTFTKGIGKYMDIKYTYIGMKDFNLNSVDELNTRTGIYPYFLLHPLNKSQQWYELSHDEREKLIKEREDLVKSHNKIIENFFLSYGLGDEDLIVTREAQDLNELINVTAKLKSLKTKSFTTNDKPVFLCIGKDLREILDLIV